MVDANPRILVVNCGSSSIKFALLEPRSGIRLASGIADRIGAVDALLICDIDGTKREWPIPAANHSNALRQILVCLESALGDGFRVDAIGHRVVHGGEHFTRPAWIDDKVIADIDRCISLAPLHNPAHLAGIRCAQEIFPGTPQVAVFDTAFHQTLPARAFLYAIPHELYSEHGVRRYGFHGTSHQFVASEAARRLGRPLDELEIVTAHLGNGCSAAAIGQGKSLDTTMGLTPLEGLVMGTRCGDVDANLHLFLAERLGLNLHEITDLLNKRSGLLGLSGLSNDMRALTQAAEAGQARAAEAIDVFCYRLSKAILALCAALTRLDAIVFTGGIGEHSAPVRTQTVGHLGVLRASIDPARNALHGRESDGRIDSGGTPAILVVPTNEELMIARQTEQLLCQL